MNSSLAHSDAGGATAPPRREPTAFRTDIQGLRAVAILTVLGSHAAVSGFAGGFVGVDVFFVISGFLITQQLLGEVAATGRLSLVGFYARRARRILPAAGLVLVNTVLVTALVLGPIQVGRIATDATWAAGFLANVRMALTGTDYFDSSMPPSPVQHYWSLAVEEQFYVVWPLLVIAVVVLLRRRSSRSGGAIGRALLATVLALSLASLAWSVARTDADPTAAYFSTLTRAWELGVGAAAALVVAQRRALTWLLGRVRVAQAAGLVGLLGIGYAVVTYDGSTAFPGSAALLPVLGTALVILAGAVVTASATPVGRLLSVAPLRAIGDWSYSLYLWHWPVLVIPATALQRDLSALERGIAIAASLALAWLSYTFVEVPFRRGSIWRNARRPLLLYPLTLLLVLAAGLVGHKYADLLEGAQGFQPAITVPASTPASTPAGTPATTAGPSASPSSAAPVPPALDPQEQLVKASVQAARRGAAVPTRLRPALTDLDSAEPARGRCDYVDDSVRRLCPEGDASSSKVMVVLGNSHALHWMPALDRVAKAAHYRVYFLVKNRCVSSTVTTDLGDRPQPYTACDAFNDWTFAQVARLRPDLAIVSTAPPIAGVFDDEGHHLTSAADVDRVMAGGYRGILGRLQKVAQRVVLLKDIVAFDRNPGQCLSVRGNDLGDCLMHTKPRNRAAIDVQVRAARAQGVEVVSMDSYFCWDGACPSVVGDVITHYDGTHMSAQYAPELARPLGRRLGLLE